MSFSDTFPQRKKHKEALRNELDDNTSPSSLPDSSASSCCSSVSVSDQCSDPDPERPSSPGSNSDVPPSRLKARSEIAPGSADDMCVSSGPLESYWFPNIGNTCFMNATLQCLRSLACFWTSIIAQQASSMDTASSQTLWYLPETPHPSDVQICECEQSCRASEVQEFSILPRWISLTFLECLHLESSLGYYITDVPEGEGDSWLTFNDSKVSRTNESAVLKRRAKTAYLLFYVRR
ncbi:hypothetical protein AOLI_G00043760 [Acnodon oligacanthus]